MSITKPIKLVSDTIDNEDISSLCEWLLQRPTPRLTKGELTVKLEKAWAKKIGTEYSVFVNSGSSAILLLLAAYKENYAKGRRVKIVVPDVSWATDVSSPMLLDYDISLCDCNLHDLSCSTSHLEEIFKRENPDIFLSVSALGLVPNMDVLIYLCKKYDVILLEDNCESTGSMFDGKMLGSFGEASVFSTYYGHHISTIEGGFINTSNKELYYTLLAMRSHGWSRDLPEEEARKLSSSWSISDFNNMYTFYAPGLNVRSTDLQAFIGLRMLRKMDKYSLKRNDNFKYYFKNIKGNVLFIEDTDEVFVSNFAYPVVSFNKDKIVKELMENNIEVRPLIAGSIGAQPFWRKKHEPTNFNNSTTIHRYGFYIPNHQDLTTDEMDRIIDIINKYA